MVSTDKFNLLHSYIFRKNNVTMANTFLYKDKSILYIACMGNLYNFDEIDSAEKSRKINYL